MQDVSPTRLPPIDIHVKKLAREPEEKPWPKFKKVLIDYPRDRNLLYRQKLWDFQKMNRGAFRSHVASLPEIPYRVNTNKPETASVGIQSDMRMLNNNGLKLILPQISRTINKITDKLDAYLNSEDDGRETRCSHVDCIGHYDDMDIEDPGYEFDTVSSRKNAGTMTDPFRKNVSQISKQTKRPVRKKKILKDKNVSTTERPNSRKIVKFEDEDQDKMDMDFDTFELQEAGLEISNQVDEETENKEEQEEAFDDFDFTSVDKLNVEELQPRPPSSSSSSNGSSLSLEAENIGPSSHLNLDPLSVLDFLSGSRIGDARVMLRDGKKRELEKDFEETPRRTKVKAAGDVEAERKWYKKIVGDKDLIDFGNYENFARTRPTNDSSSDVNEKYVDLGKNTPRRSTNYTPRIYSDFAPAKLQGRMGNNNPYLPASKKTGDTPTKSRTNSRRTVS